MDIVQDDDDPEESEEEEEAEEEETENGYDEDDEEREEEEDADNESVEVGMTRRKTDEPSTSERPSQSTIDDLQLPETAVTSINSPKASVPENGFHLRSPDELTQKVESLNLSDIKTRVTSDLSKTHSYQQRKYHSKRSTRQVGRPQGSKAKQDKKVRLDRSGIWH